MTSSIQNVDPSYYRNLTRLPKAFSYQELEKATNDFSEMLGEGGFGSVFKGCLEDGTPIAVKRIEVSDNCKILFEAEVSTIASLRHKNLVRLQGFCSNEIKKRGNSYIVYDLLRNGSLNTWILPKEGSPSDHILSWKFRYQIAIDVAQALVYLHDHCRPPIIHFDVKPANVLLDDSFRGVLADFGLSVMTKKDGSFDQSCNGRGTLGYIAPEMLKSFKSDMYSFGKVLLDMFFGQVYVCLDMSGNDIYNKDGNSLAEKRTFHSFLREKLESNEIVHLADKRLGRKMNESEANILIDVALRCVEEDPSRRPLDMQQVLQLLNQGWRYQGRQVKKRKTQMEKASSSGSGSAPKETPCPEGKDLLKYASLEPVPIKRSKTFLSQQSAKHKILEALQDNQVSMVGVYGMGGVGKTTLMKQILRDAKSSSLFEIVLMVTISQNRPLEEIQTEIAEKLGMKFEETSVSVRAMRLYVRLKRAKSLVILDDMWKELSLEEVGIPCEENHHGCKVVMTTRYLDVCTGMDVQAIVEVQVLEENESWELFCQNAGKDIDSNEIQSLAKTIVQECKGLPLAIIVLAKALKGKKRDLWDAALQQLKRSACKDISTALSSIRWSYDYLESKDTKFCFLLCCLFPEDYKISMDELLMYAVGEDILADADTLAEVRGWLFQVVENLISSSLLLKCDASKFMMHDIVRDAAISIASENGNNFIVKAGMGLSEWPQLKDVRHILRLSLMSNGFSALPNQLGCQRLVTLSLALNRKLTFTNEFFTGMTALKTLDLRGTDISSLPQSLSALTDLRTLDLRWCLYLVDVSMLGCLRNLEILNLSRCNIRRLPKEFKSLINLKLLNLYGNNALVTIPPNVISSLIRLEELYLPSKFSNWESEGMGKRENACLSELSSLTSLNALHLVTNDVSLLYKDPPFQWKNLKEFKIAVDSFPWGDNCSNTLAISSVDDIKVVAEWVRELWKRTDELCLSDDGRSITNVIPRLHSNFNNLKSLTLRGCEKMEYVVQLEEIGDEAIFRELEKLDLSFCNTKAICSSGPLPNGFLDKLKVLDVSYCEFVNVIPGELLVNLRNLESVALGDCSKAEVLFNSEEGHASVLSELREMRLDNLLQLRTIWKGFSSETIPRNLKIVRLFNCKMLRYIFPVFMANNLPQLEELEIHFCESMHIFGSEEDEEEEINEISICSQPPVIRAVLTRLKRLSLFANPRLSGFCSHRSVIFSFPSLEDVTIKSCDDLRRLPFGLDCAPKLEDLNSEPQVPANNKRLKKVLNETEANTLVDVALRCVEYDPSRRPRNMQSVLQLEQGQQDQHEYGGTTDDTQQAEGREAKKRDTHIEKASSSGQAPKENPYPVAYYAPPQSVPDKHSETFASQESHRSFDLPLRGHSSEILPPSHRHEFGSDKITVSQRKRSREHVPTFIVENLYSFETREATKDKVIKSLMDFNTTLIGVYGIEGVGKTTLMKQVCEEVKLTNLFDNVVLTTISRNPNLIGIQRDISKTMWQGKNILIVLDDLWAILELTKLGIFPCGDSAKTCKVVIITRSLDVCYSMGTTTNIEVEVLSEPESLKLFQKIIFTDSEAIAKMSAYIVKQCEGLPSAILTFARALTGNDEAVWPKIIKHNRKTLFWGMFDELKSKVKNQLLPLETDIQVIVDLARSKREPINTEVQNWQSKVAIVGYEIVQLFREATDIIKFKGRSACHRLCEESRKRIIVIDEILKEGKSFLPHVVECCDPFASRELTKKKIIQALMEDNINMVGVHGFEGLGKTILVKQMHKEVKETNLFSEVVFVTVSRNPDIIRIQADIAKSMGIIIKEKGVSERAGVLAKRLSKEKRILLILDDIHYKELKLADLGINLSGIGENICKVLITSRSIDACYSMGSSNNFEVKFLSHKNSIELFRQEVGDADTDMFEDVIGRMRGMPFAIVTLAKALRNKDRGFRLVFLKQLKSLVGVCPYKLAVKISYEFLERETQQFLLLCALFPGVHKIPIDTLVGYTMGENLLEAAKSIREAREKVIRMVDTLVYSGLVFKGEDCEFVMMQHIVRDAAIDIKNEQSNKSIIKTAEGLSKWPCLKEDYSILRISLMNNDIREIPDRLEFSNLVTLSLARNRLLNEIPDLFFNGMNCLATLDLSSTGISSLPKSFHFVGHSLRSLYLDDCIYLEDISAICHLHILEILSLQRTKLLTFSSVPLLTNLKMLAFS